MYNNLYIWFNTIVSNHNWSLALIYRWNIFAIELEKINKIKEFPSYSFSRILPKIQREMFNNIDELTNNKEEVLSFRNYLDDTINNIIKRQNIDFKKIDKIYTLNFPFDISVRWQENKVIKYKYNYHHFFHACSTYYPSLFNESVILCMDHDWYDSEIDWWKNVMHTIWYAKWNEIKNIYYDKYDAKDKKIWIGAVYEMHSNICWIWEWTLMWLSWYWNNKLSHIKIFDFSKWWAFLDEKYFENIDFSNDLKNWYDVADYMDSVIIDNFRKVYQIDWIWIKENIENSIYADISDKVQTEIEEAILFLARKAYDLTWCKNICIAWWVGLNIIANNRILRETNFESIFVQPACNDAWLSLWGLYYMYHNILWNTTRIKLNSPWLWFEYDNIEIEKNINNFSDKFSYKKLWDDKYKIIAKILKEDNVIWWFQWRWEFWPRSLWFRSILASPISISMKNKVNHIKEREKYRPLAPIMLEEDFREYLDTSYSSPYMTLVANVLESKKNKIPSVTHIDWTARYQTVNKSQNKWIYKLLNEFKKLTWVSVLINTSFNQHDEPIIETPEDAIKMFLATDLDYLFIWDFLLSKEQKKLEYKFDKNKVNNEFNKKIKQSKNNNIRWETMLKLLWISKLWFNYNYDIWDKWILFTWKDIKFIIEILKESKEYNFVIWKIWLLIENWDNKKVIEIIKIFLQRNENVIFNLIKWI